MTDIVYASSLQEAHHLALDQIDNGNTKPFLLSLMPPEELIQRLSRVRHGIFDFDDTLAISNQHAELRHHLSQATAKFDQEILDWMLRADKTFMGIAPEDIWFADQENPELIERAMFEAAFVARNLTTFGDEGITRGVIEQIGASMEGRVGATELFARLDETCIITYGFQQIIEAWCSANAIKTMAAGIRFIYGGDNDRIIGFHPGSVVTGATKGIVAKRFRALKGISGQPILTMGDRPFDLEMMYEHEAAVNALIFAPNKAKGRFDSFDIPENRERFKRVSCVLISDSLQPIVDLLPAAPFSQQTDEAPTDPQRRRPAPL